jgi:phage gpG-like protein
MYLSFNIEGDIQISRNLTQLESNMKDWSPEFKDTGEYLKGFFSGEVFDSEGSVFNEPWQALSPAYAIQKEKKYPGKGILVATGKMRDSFKYDNGSTYVRVYNDVQNSAGVNYFVFHQSNKPRYRLPRRIVMKLDERRKQDIIQIFRRGLQRQINRSGFKSLYH